MNDLSKVLVPTYTFQRRHKVTLWIPHMFQYIVIKWDDKNEKCKHSRNNLKKTFL